MKRTFYFKYLDLTLLLLCIVVTVWLAVAMWYKELFNEFMYSVPVLAGYITISAILNRIFLPRQYRSPLRTPAEIALLVCLVFLVICFTGNFQMSENTIMGLAFFSLVILGLPCAAFICLITTIAEAVIMRRAFRKMQSA
jgi:hypothetical protein